MGGGRSRFVLVWVFVGVLFGGVVSALSYIGETPGEGSTVLTNAYVINVSSEITGDNYIHTDINNDTLLWINFDDLDTGLPFDNSTYNSTIAAPGADPTQGSGKFGNGFDFDSASSQYLTATNSHRNLTEMTITTWVKFNNVNAADYQHLFEIDVDTRMFWSHSGQPNKMYYEFDNDGGSCAGSVSLSLENDTWYNIVVTYSASQGLGRMYLDGEIVNSDTDGCTGTIELNDNWEIGRRSSANYLNGSMDEFLVVNRSLSQDEVKALYNSSANQFYSSQSGVDDDDYNLTTYEINSTRSQSEITRGFSVSNVNVTAFSINNRTNTTSELKWSSDNAVNYTFFIFNDSARTNLINSVSNATVVVQTNTLTEFTGLNSDTKYYATIQMCNADGCINNTDNDFNTLETISSRREVSLDSHLIFHGLEMTSIIQVPLSNGFYRWDLWDKYDLVSNQSVLEDGLVSVFAWNNLLTNNRFQTFNDTTKTHLSNWTEIRDSGTTTIEYSGERAIIIQEVLGTTRLRQNLSGLLEADTIYYAGLLAQTNVANTVMRITDGTNIKNIAVGVSTSYQFDSLAFNTTGWNLNNIYVEFYAYEQVGNLTISDVWLVKSSNSSYPATNYNVGDEMPRQYVGGYRLFTTSQSNSICNGVDTWCGGGHGGDKNVSLDFDSQANYLKITRTATNYFFNNTVYYVYDWNTGRIYESYFFGIINDFTMGSSDYYGMQTPVNDYENVSEYLNGDLVNSEVLPHDENNAAYNTPNDQLLLIESGDSYWTNDSIFYTFNGNTTDVRESWIWSRAGDNDYDKIYQEWNTRSLITGDSVLGNLNWVRGNLTTLQLEIGNTFMPDYLLYSDGTLVKTIANNSILIQNESQSGNEMNISCSSSVYLRIINSTNSEVDLTLSSEDYNINLSSGTYLEIISLVVTSASPAETTSSGGSTPTYHPTESNLQQGYSKQLGRFWKLNFKFGTESHQLKIDNLNADNKTVTITISSEPQTKTLSVGEGWKVNLDDDNYYDLLVRLDNVTSIRADVFIREINEEIEFEVIEEGKTSSEEIIEDEGENNSWLYFVVGVVIFVVLWVVIFVAVGLVFIVIKKARKKENF